MALSLTFLDRWRADRDRRRRTQSYIRSLMADPLAEDARWLAERATVGDLDHARWELRYARRALGLLTAERDALDDRTGSDVARALATAVAADPNVAADKRAVAEQQFNARLRGYGEALSHRTPGETTGGRLGRTLLTFCGVPGELDSVLVARAGDVLAQYLADANQALRRDFGEAALPENVPPSEMAGAARGGGARGGGGGPGGGR